MEIEINKVINDMKNSIVYQMSLGNKELFHSNLWKWLIQQKPKLVNVFFSTLNANDIMEVRREDKNRDIVIKLNNVDEYIIENKIKSYPDKEQLERYSEKKKYPHFIEGIITGIKPPSFNLPIGWKFKSYSEIADGILSYLNIFDRYEQEVLEDYCKMIQNLNSLLYSQMEKNDKKLCYWSEELHLLYDVNLMDVYRKLKGDDFVLFSKNKLENHFIQKVSEIGCVFEVKKPSFHNGKTTLDFEIKKDEAFSVGIQIEDDQYRLFCCKRDLRGDDLFNHFVELGWFDGTFPVTVSKKSIRTVFGNETRMTKKYCGYSGNEWIYQYYSVYKAFNNSYDKILEQLFKDLENAIKILEINL